MNWYYGPTDYSTLKKYEGTKLDEVADMGWGIFGWINKYVFVHLFKFLSSFTLNFGLIIILMTIAVRIIMSPLVYKSYVSSAKMKVLRPEMEEINKRLPGKENAMKRQQETMAIQRKAGVSMLSGCIPALLQMPVFFALFRFFPSNIDLRQKSFLWADDLSSYDSIYDLGFEIPFYGDHVSLFTLLMAVSTFLYTKYNTQTAAMGGAQGQQMKIMMYMMPFFFLGFFNNFASGLSYYYFLSNIISMIQQWVIKRFFINEDEIHRKIQENKKNPKKTKVSKFQRKLEDMAKQRGYDANKKK